MFAQQLLLLYLYRRMLLLAILLIIIVTAVSTSSMLVVFSFVITTTTTSSSVLHRLHPQYSSGSSITTIPKYHLWVAQRPVDDTVTAAMSHAVTSLSSNIDNHNHNITNCCVIHSLQFPSIAYELSDQLSIPLITMESFVDTTTTTVVVEGDTTLPVPAPHQPKYQHAIVIEPYTYENRIHNYSIGIVSLNDPSNNNKNRKPGKRIMKMNPHIIDFIPPMNSLLGRRTFGESGQPDLLLKAIRLPTHYTTTGSSRSIDRYTSPNNDDEHNNNDSGATDHPTNISQHRPIVIYDVTAGFGQDALLMAHYMIKKSKSSIRTSSIGRVHMIERNPIIAALLRDALRRLQLIATTENSIDDNNNDSMNIAQQLYQCLSMEWDDGLNTLTKLSTTYDEDNNVTIPDIVYLDPMFPTRKKSASVKKNMQILHSLLQEPQGTSSNTDDTNDSNYENGSCDELIDVKPTTTSIKDEAESMLLQMAYKVARYRVIVKRPIHAPSIPFSTTATATTTTCSNNTVATTTGSSTVNIGTNIVMTKPSYQIIGTINRWDVYNKQ